MTAIIIRPDFRPRPREVEPGLSPIEIAAAKFDQAHAAWQESPCTASLLHRLWAHANLLEMRDAKSYRQARAEAAEDAAHERSCAVLMGVYRGNPDSPISELSEEWKRERWTARDGGAA